MDFATTNFSRKVSRHSLAYLTDIKRGGSLNLNLIEFFDENNETTIYLSQTPIKFLGKAGRTSQIFPENMPFYDQLWSYLTNETVIAILGPYCARSDPFNYSTDPFTQICSDDDRTVVSSNETELTTSEIIKETPLGKPFQHKPQYLVLIAVNKTIIQYFFLNVSKI